MALVLHHALVPRQVRGRLGSRGHWTAGPRDLQRTVFSYGPWFLFGDCLRHSPAVLGGGEGTLQSYELDSLTKGNGDSLRQTEIQKRVIVTEIRVYEWP